MGAPADVLAAVPAKGLSVSMSDAEADALSAAILGATADAAWLVDETGRTLWANGRLSELLGGTAGAPARLNFLDFSTDEAAAECFRACRSEQANQRREMSFGRNGGVAWADVRLVPFGPYQTSASATLVMISDVTGERTAEAALRTAVKELEERLRENCGPEVGRQPNQYLQHQDRLLRLTAQIVAANKELEAFSYSVSHDLREPLRSIDGFSRILLARYDDVLDERGKDYLGRVCAAAQKMGRLIADMLALARIARAEMLPQPVNMSQIAELVGRELAESSPHRSVTVTVAPDLSVVADPRLMTVVLNNLIGNAWKFTSRRADAIIEFTGCPSETEYVFRVGDNGAGFEMKYVEKLFRPFQRLHTDADFMGTGIGLATVQRIVARHGGRVWAEAVVGKGAQVFFSIPRTSQPEPASIEPRQS